MLPLDARVREPRAKEMLMIRGDGDEAFMRGMEVVMVLATEVTFVSRVRLKLERRLLLSESGGEIWAALLMRTARYVRQILFQIYLS